MKAPVEIAEAVISRVASRAEAEVYVSGGPSSLTRFANSFIHQNVVEESTAVSLRVSVSGRVASASITNATDEGLDRLVEDTIALAGFRPVDDEWPGIAAEVPVPEIDHFDQETAAASPADRARVVRQFVDAAPEFRAAGYCETESPTVAFANSGGHRATGRYSRATLDGIHQSESSAGSGHATAASLGDISGPAVGEMAATRTRDGIAPHDIKPGEYEVVLAPEAVGTIAIFLGFYGLNAKAHLEGQSFAELGSKQFDSALDVVDDVTDARALGLPFDHEGTAKGRVELIKDGVTNSLAHDRRTAGRSGVESTGHALPGSDVWGPLPYTMFPGGGDVSVEPMIAPVDRGVHVSTFNYCRVLDPKTLVVTGLTRNGTFMIENGELMGAVTNISRERSPI